MLPCEASLCASHRLPGYNYPPIGVYCWAQIKLTTELLKRFSQHAVAWQALQEALAVVDVLVAFATFASSAESETCRPVFLPAGERFT